jgi:cell wall-associated NlpC family hydrolase
MGGGRHYAGNDEHISPGIDSDWGKKVTPSNSKPNADRKYHGLDCSGFTRWVYKYVTGKNPGYYAADIFNASQKIGKTELKPGDIGFISKSGGNHIGIFLGRGNDGNYYFIHSSGYSSKAGPQGLGGVLISAYEFNRFGRIKVTLNDK